jgi:hypothetical protein
VSTWASRACSAQRLNEDRTIGGCKLAEVVDIAREEHPATSFSGHPNNMSIDDVFRSEAGVVEDRSDEPGEFPIGISAPYGINVSSQKCIDELGAASSAVQFRKHDRWNDNVSPRPGRSLHRSANSPFGCGVWPSKDCYGLAVEGDNQRPPSARS